MNYSLVAAKRFSDYVDARYQETAKCFRLSVSQVRILLALYERDGLSIVQLSAATNMSNGHTSRMVSRLEERGYVTTLHFSEHKFGGKYYRSVFLDRNAIAIRQELLCAVNEVERNIQASIFDFFPIGLAS